MTNEEIERVFMGTPSALTAPNTINAPFVVRDDARRHLDWPAYTREHADDLVSYLREVDPQARPRVVQRRGETP